MPTLLTVLPGTPLADEAARYILSRATADARAQAVVFVPTRRAAVSMRVAFARALGGEVSLLPRILPIADIDEALLTLLGTDAITALESIPPAMSAWQQRYLLASQVRAFLKQRHDAVTLDYPLALAADLLALEDQCARAGVTLTPDALRMLSVGNSAEHWQQAREFLDILAAHWPAIEAAAGQTTRARREVRILEALTEAWQAAPPEYPVFVVGSTASQESTAALMQVIAELPRGAVILPGIDPEIDAMEWNSIESGHPLFHLKHFLDRISIAPSALNVLGGGKSSIWAKALSADMTQWHTQSLPNYDRVKLVACAHPESEARVITLLMREALESPDMRTALITPDESLMGRVAAQMKRYGVTIDRLDRGTLAQTELGSLWTALMAAIAEPERLIHIRALLHHPLIQVSPLLLSALEPYWYGVALRRVGQMPKLPETVRGLDGYVVVERLVRQIARLARGRFKPSEWVMECNTALSALMRRTGTADEPVSDILETLSEADILGAVAPREFISLLAERLEEPRRHGGVTAHPNLVMLTPVEARLEQFDRVILGSMTEAVWPGMPQPNAWLNLSAQAALGLPPPTHQVSLMAHDVLMFGSASEVFLTWPERDQGSPMARSRFVERLVTFLAMHGVTEDAVTAYRYTEWADEVFAAAEFAPAEPPKPLPARGERPSRLPVSALDRLFSDPFSVYAQYVLGLRKLDVIDADPEASDFGSLAHKAIHQLTVHWNETGKPASAEALAVIADHALRDFFDRPSTVLFWRSRLVRALSFVNEKEMERRVGQSLNVKPEQPVEAPFELPGNEAITLHGQIDRVEQGAGTIIGDYKTGAAKSKKEILEGEATQLLAYAMLVGDPEAVEYWWLPHGRHAGEVARVAFAELLANGLPEALKAGLADMLKETTPFLATPSRLRDYDGISRYEEWAG